MKFVYTEGESSDDLKTFVSVPIDSETNNAIYNTLKQIFDTQGVHNITSDKGAALSYAVWNDEAPSGKTISGGGHTKGAFAADTKSGFWLIQSLPKFPDTDGPISSMWSKSASNYGQHYFCISVTANDINNIAGQYLVAQPQVYASANNANLANVAALIASKWSSETTKTLHLTVGGFNFTSFIKSPSWGKDLYEDFVQPALQVKAGFAWETWRRSPYMDAYCPPSYAYPSLNVEGCSVGGDSFSYTDDHSKYGVSQDSGSPYVCIGDINRMASQFKRGGGTLCFQHKNLWEAMSGVTTKVDTCS